MLVGWLAEKSGDRNRIPDFEKSGLGKSREKSFTQIIPECVSTNIKSIHCVFSFAI